MALLVAILGVVSWVGVRGALAYRHLHRSRAAAADLRDAVVGADDRATREAYRDAAAHAAAARRLTDDVVWRTVARAPFVGDAMTSARGIGAVVDGVTRGPLRSLVHARRSLDPGELRNGDGSVDVNVLGAPQRQLAATLPQLDDLERRVDQLPERTAVGVVDAARVELARELRRLRTLVRHAEAAARVGPAMLGRDGVRRYFVAFQNTAESRGTGGLLGAFGILEADRGRLRMIRIGSDSELQVFRQPVAKFDADFESHYRGTFSAATYWGNANLSPHFPYAAQIWLEMWRRQFGQRLDGVIATDPSMLALLLEATGPVSLPTGDVVTGKNVVDLTQRTLYARFRDDNNGRKDFLKLIVESVADHALHRSNGTPAGLAKAFRQGVNESRIRVWSRYDDEKRALAGTSLAGELPDVDGPFAQLVINNAGANKLDFYLDRKVTYALGRCVSPESRQSRITVTLTSALPDSELPDYVSGASHDPAQAGVNTVVVSMFAARGAEFAELRVDGEPSAMSVHRERGHAVATTQIRLLPRRPVSVTYDVLEPISDAEPDVPVQPLVRSQRTVVSSAPCLTATPVD